MIDWDSVSFEVDGIPPSKNTNNWSNVGGRMATKKKWRGIYIDALHKLNLPMPIPHHAEVPLIAMVTVRFTLKSQSPEIINFEPAIKECLADALRRSDEPKLQGWIDDDTDDLVRISVHQMKDRGKRSHRIELRWMEEPEPEEEPEAAPFFESDAPVAQLPS